MRNKRKPPDFLLFATVMTLITFGLIMVYSSSEVTSFYRHGDSFYFLKKQLLWALIGLGVMTFFMNFDYWKIRKLVWLGLGVSFLLLVLVLIPGIGKTVNGAQRWINLGAFAFQPSEIIKLSLVIFVAHLAAYQGYEIRKFVQGLGPHLVVLALACGLILMQPDLGTAVAAAGTVFVMLFSAGARAKHLVSLGAAGLTAVVIAILLEPYRMKRIFAFMDPYADPLGAGYHIIQSLYALGSGGFFGLGLGESLQKHMYLPEQHTDFIFAVIGEELGFMGAGLVLLLFIMLVWRGLKVAIMAPDTFSSLLAVGLTTMVVLQALVNIGVVTGSLPVTGITLPFISFGGTSLVFALAGIGILLNISRYTTIK